jgi:homoserine dehydrogenase
MTSTSTSTLRHIKVILVGTGAVGRTLIKQILQAQSYHHQRYALQFHFIGLLDSSGIIGYHSKTSKSQYLDTQTLQSIIQHKIDGNKLNTHENALPASITSQQYIHENTDLHTIVVDCSASDRTAELLITSLKNGSGVVLANKKPLTLSQSIYDQLYQSSGRIRLRYESTCGAGTPMIASLRRLLDAHDLPSLIQGTFSGTLGYLTSELQNGKNFSDIVNEAAKLGYTEPDPRDDLGGVDVARKALILARTMGLKLELSDIDIQALYPSSFASLSIPEFIKRLPELNQEYSKKNQEAQKNKKVLRYVATVNPTAAGGQRTSCTVGLKELDSNSPIGLLTGSENMIEYHTSIYKPQPLVVRGYGAGAEVTAAGVLADMIEIADILWKQE